jgi:hypothetical protein
MDMSSDATFHTLQEDIESWQADLPTNLRFDPDVGGQQTGLLLLLSCCVDVSRTLLPSLTQSLST